jgi:ABC-type multidrug transport system fused ATPase/permease subunit
MASTFDPARAVRHLLLSVPDVDVVHSGMDVVDSLVEGAMAQLVSRHGLERLYSASDVTTAIHEYAGLTYERAELVSCLERLSTRGKIHFRDEGHRAFVVSEDAYRAARELFMSRMAAWDTVRSTWLDRVMRRHQIEAGQAAALWEGIDTFTAELINGYGAEAAAFLYADDGSGQTRFYEALSHNAPKISDHVPSGLAEIAHAELLEFFNPDDPAATEYIAGRLRASFFFHLLSVDPEASRLVREHVASKTLYLDSNFIFRLLGFHGLAPSYGPMTAVEVSRQLECRLVVAGETINEYIRVVRAAEHQLKATPIRSDTYLNIAATRPVHEGEFMATYYRELVSGRVKNVSEFVLRWTNVRVHLEEWGIAIEEDTFLDEAERDSEAFRDAASQLSQWHRSDKSPEAVDHDMYMLRHLGRLRGPLQTTPAAASHWFITYDRHLTRYSAYYATEGQPPSVILADDWLQVVRPFLPRTDDYAKSFVVMLKNPLLYSGATVPFAHIAGSLARLERFTELPTRVVSAMLADAQFVRAFSFAERDDEARDLLEVKLKEIADEVAEANERLHQRLGDTLGQLEQLQRHVDEVRDARDEALQREQQARASAAVETRRSADAITHLAGQLDEERRAAAAAVNDAIATTAAATAAAVRAENKRQVRTYVSAAAGLSVTLAAVFYTVAAWGTLTLPHVAILAAWVAVTWTVLVVWGKGWSTLWTAVGGIIALTTLLYLTVENWSSASVQGADGGQPQEQLEGESQ